MKRLLVAFGAAGLLVACGQHQEDKTTVVAGISTAKMDSARTEIAAANASFGKAMITGDSAAVADLYHSESKVFPPNQPAIDGKGMGAMSRTMAGMQLAKFDVKTTDLSASGDMIVETGTWSIGVTGKELDHGKSLVIWKEEGGHWKMWRDMWNSDVAPH